MQKMLLALAALPLAAACTTTPDEPAGCEADRASGYVGQPYTEALGEELLEVTGAEILRAGHQNDPVTMDYRADRLTVGWDDERRITRISCG